MNEWRSINGITHHGDVHFKFSVDRLDVVLISKSNKMGVKDLWLILSPVCEKKSLWELQDQTVAIDLSVWICENQKIDYCNNNLYLRNLFFRTSYMLLLGIKPIFVLEGKAPELKHDTMKQRRHIQNKSKSTIVGECQDRAGNRSRLRSLQKQCEELLKYMGVSCVYSEGEAEALCAVLNSRGIVDGVITKDSDCFLYGARTVYRNFNISCNGGTFEKYDMSLIEEKLSLGRNKLIALSLLCGCDYNMKGIDGIGKESALKFLSTVTDSHVLSKFSRWRDDLENNDEISKIEKNIKQKALLDPAFPFQDIQNEFLHRQYDLTNVIYSWTQPNIREFVILSGRKLGWNADYAIEKFLPLLSRWHLLHDDTGNQLNLDYIVKKRNLRGVPSYEVKWNDFDQNTIEPMSYLKRKYQNAIDDFQAAKRNKTKKATAKKNRIKEVPVNVDDITSELHNLSFDVLNFNANIPDHVPRFAEDSITVSDFECSATDLLELSSIVESIVTRQ